MTFDILKTDASSFARRGVLHTAHGDIHTPVFMPVGTQGTVKAVSNRELEELGAQIILGNTYHLNLRPGMELMAEAGGLHRFMAWPHPILTDSGGFQVFSLAKLNKVMPDGVRFQSHLDGSRLFLGPRESMAIQRTIGSDIAMAFDECTPWPATYDRARKSLLTTLRWAEMSRQQPRAEGQLVFGIAQGSTYPELRRQSIAALADLDFDGMAVGGVSVGEPEKDMVAVLDVCAPDAPSDDPWHPARHRHVRLRPADAHGPERQRLSPDRHDSGQGRKIQERFPAHPGRLPMLCLPSFQPRLYPASAPRRRNHGRAAHDDPQPPLLPQSHGAGQASP